MKNEFWEIGGDFNAESVNFSSHEAWFSNAIFLATGRTSIILLKSILVGRTLYYPDYYCWDVIEFWKLHGIKVQPYRVFFSNNQIKVDFSTVPKNEVVLAVNFFGSDDGRLWKKFRRKNFKVTLIEDHSHSPMSEWAKNSNADFAFSSLRKTLPIPDGCILWSPSKKKIPKFLMQPFNSSLKNKAMMLKSQYLEGKKIKKNSFLKLYAAGEKLLLRSKPHSISKDSYKNIIAGYPCKYMNIRKKNLKFFLSNLKENTIDNIELLSFLDTQIPFGVFIKCKTIDIKNHLKNFLAKNKIYCPVHWPQKKGSVLKQTYLLSKTSITIPIDQRYSLRDITIITKKLNYFFKAHK